MSIAAYEIKLRNNLENTQHRLAELKYLKEEVEGADKMSEEDICQFCIGYSEFDNFVAKLTAQVQQNIELLCSCYSLEDLIMQREKLCGEYENRFVIDKVSLIELDEAIATYNHEEYSIVRKELLADQIKLRERRKKYGLI